MQPILEILDSRIVDDDGLRAGALGISRRQYQRTKIYSDVEWITADKYAVALGLHPACIWKEWTDCETYAS